MAAARGLTLLLLVVAYFVAGGLTLAFVSASGVWPLTGLAIAALLLLGLGYWPS